MFVCRFVGYENINATPLRLKQKNWTLTGNHFYHVLLGELYKEINKIKALEHLKAAYQLARSETDKAEICRKIQLLDPV